MTETVLEVRNLSVRYGSVLAVDDVTLDISRGELTALVGPSGCGKTSFLRAVAGLEIPESGSITIEGEEMVGPARWVPPQRRQVGMVFQEGALFPHFTVWQNVLYGVQGRADGEDSARRALQVVGLEGLDRRYPDQLSGGQQQRVALARALAPSPRMVLLDEPFASLDAGLRLRVRAEVRSILERTGTTSVLVTHDQEEALSIADWVVVMDHGRVLQVGRPSDVYRRPDSVEVARFFGEGRLVECEVKGGRVSSELGSTSSASGDVTSADGKAWLWVRPEDVSLRAVEPGDHDGDRPIGELVAERFFGHDLLQDVRLDSGEHVWVRNLTSDCLGVGQRVCVSLREQAMRVFAGDEIPGRGVRPAEASDPHRQARAN